MPLRETARRIFLNTLDHIQVAKVMQRYIRCDSRTLRIGDITYSLNQFRCIKVVSVGKAAVPMATTLTTLLRPYIAAGQTLDGIVVGTTTTECQGMRFFLGGHPIPNEQSILAAASILRYLSDSDSETLVIFLISGGASTMLEQPLDPAMTMEDTVTFHQILVHSGLPIQEMNMLRKHFSAVKGGRLAVAAAKATKCTLLISDVPDDKLHIVGSGPTLPDPSTVADSLSLLDKHREILPFPQRVKDFFNADMPETPKESDEAFLRASSFALLSSKDLYIEATGLSEQEGFFVAVDNSCDEWPYDMAAEYLLRRLSTLRMTHDKVCLLSAGEISVKVEDGQGVGGRNQHFVLECAVLMAKSGQRATVLSAGTDGIDGNSQATGGLADETTVERALGLGLSVSAALTRFDSNTVLHALRHTDHRPVGQ